MKKFLVFAAIAALFSFTSCQKEETPTKEEAKDIVFTATIDNSGTKTIVDAANKKVAWEVNDQINVEDSSNPKKTAIYRVSAINAGVATFTKVSGDVLTTAPFTATYGSAPSTSQTYSATAPALPMSATSSTTSLTFTVTCGLLELTLTQTGESIKSIKVSDNATTPNTYTLNCGSGVSIASGAKFYIAVPAGTYTTFQFTNGTDVVRGRAGLSIVVAANHIKPVSSNFAPKYPEGSVSQTDLDYGIKIGSTWWAPLNCGYDATYTYGLLYQWGRKYGQAYEVGTITPSSLTKAQGQDVANKDVFGSTNETNSNWYKGDIDNTLWKANKTDYDPCPTGWRVPVENEMNSLITKYSSWATKGGQNGYYCSGSVAYSENVPSVFLPAAGSRHTTGNLRVQEQRTTTGAYWTASAGTGEYGRTMSFNSSGGPDMYDSFRAFGRSVRCVKE